MPFGPNLRDFAVITMDRSEWLEKFRKLNFKFHDYHGQLGPQRYDYFVYRSQVEENRFGASKLYLHLQNKRSLENMRADIRDKVDTIMKERFDIDTNEAIDKDKVIFAYDANLPASVSSGTIFMNFSKGEEGAEE